MRMEVSAANTLRESPRRMLIGGELVEAEGGRNMPVEAPGDGLALGEVPAASAGDVHRAVEAAAAAFPAWRFTDLMARRKAVLDLAQLLRDNAEHLARLEAIDTGSPISAMRKDVIGAVMYLEWVAGNAFNWAGATPPTAGRGLDLTLREPYGVTARINPFNHPLYFACKLAAPMITGNTVVVKLPDQAPLSGLWLAAHLAGMLPPGVVNIVSGAGADAGEALIRHPKVARIAFTGSVPTGRRIAAAAAERFAPVHLELGGKNPMIVCADADLAESMAAAVSGMNYGTQGQSCGSYSRLFVHRSLYDQALDMLAGLVGRIRLGHPLDEQAEMGAMINARALERAESYIDSAKADGARLALGGGRPNSAELENGYYLEPTILSDVAPDMRVAREEIFGPVQSVIPWDDVDEVIAAANSTEFGLTANVCTRDLDRAFYIARRVESGTIAVNGDGAMHWFGAPFGGFKASGVGKEESLEEIIATTREKNLYLNLRSKS